MGSATIKVFTNNGKSFEYSRETVWEDYYRGSVSANHYSFVRTKSIDELIKKMNKHDIIGYGDDFLDIDEFISEMIEKYGKDFEPSDDDDEWYENSKGYGTDGFSTRLYLEEYKRNKKNLQSFVKKLQALKIGDVDKIILVQYDYDDDTDEDDADPEIWVIVNKNGKLVEGTLDETDQIF